MMTTLKLQQLMITLLTILTLQPATGQMFGFEDFLSDFKPSEEHDHDVFHPTIFNSKKRTKRSLEDGSVEHGRQPVEVKFTALGRNFHFELEPANQPFAKNSVILIRKDNQTEIYGTSDQVEKQDCLFRGTSKSTAHEKVALNFCGGFRGVLTSDTDYYVINPLNGRRHGRVKRQEPGSSEPHVIFRKPRWNKSCPHNDTKGANREGRVYFPDDKSKDDSATGYLLVEPDTFFPNEIETNEEYNLKARNYFPSRFDAPDSNRREIKNSERFFVELAIFVDRDLYRHMQENFPVDTDEHIIQVVLAMINAVQLLYSDDSLGANIEFLIKRLEILQTDPPDLERSYNIDRYLSSFCRWQTGENSQSDSDLLHWDHAVILTGLDVHVVDKNKKISAQVVGLAPVSGMCKVMSSCTVNEGRHFESVFVMAHEIGHNLGMRHDGSEAGNSCSPGSYIMSPTLGSGKISWSPCSKAYLHRFLSSSQASCLKDPGPSEIDHFVTSELLPGERFPADIQCRLRYGPDSFHSPQQNKPDLCRDLHCRREHYTWTSHPALEGTNCGSGLWCRRGTCTPKTTKKLTREPEHGGWSSWSETSCASPCLYSMSGSLASGSTGLIVSSRTCTRPRPANGGRNCEGKNFRFSTCNSVRQCMTVRKQSVADHSRSACKAASRHDHTLLPYGDIASLLLDADPAQACSVSCFTLSNEKVSRGWSFPDGTVCKIVGKPSSKHSFCIHGVCQDFYCNEDSTYHLHPDFCRIGGNAPRDENLSLQSLKYKGWTKWQPISKCSFSCLVPARGLQMMKRRCTASVCEGIDSTLGLCEDTTSGCRKLITPFQYASQTCENFRISKLSGIGMQLTNTAIDPDRACQVACQDRQISYRFYMVSGEKGWFPYGTDCSRGIGSKDAYCVKGRCLEFGLDGTPLYVPLLGEENGIHYLFKRSLILNTTTRIAGSIDQEYLEQIVRDFNNTLNSNNQEENEKLSNFDVNFDEPVDIPEPEVPGFNKDGLIVKSGRNLEELDELDESEEFLADVTIVYKDRASSCQNNLSSKFIFIIVIYVFILLSE